MVFRETMKQSPGISATQHHTPSSLSALFDEFEIEVSEVLLNLPTLIYKSESRYRFQIRWGAKRRRSAIDWRPSTPSSSSSYPSPSPQGERETQRRAKLVKVEASSPATPLSFSPSESDEKPKRSQKKVLNKKTREEWLEIIESLTQQKKLLSGELETVKSYHKKLKSFNLELKAKRHELNFGQSFLNQPMLQSSPYVEDQDHRPQIQYAAHQQPCIVDDQTVYSSQANGNCQYSYGQMTQVSSLSPGLGLNKINPASAVGIPDLNVALDDETYGMDSPQPLGPIKALADDRVKAAAAAAEARRRRMVKIKGMKSSIKLPRCR